MAGQMGTSIAARRPGIRTKLTTAPGPDIYPVWSPDGRIAYGKAEPASFAIGTISMDGRTSIIYDSPLQDIPVDWSRNGFILYRSQGLGFERTRSVDLWAVSPGSGQQPIPVAQTAADERAGKISADGRWVAFESNESGRYQIYVQSFPVAGVKTPVSIGGGRQARWNPVGNELFYVAPDARLMSVSLRPRADGQIEAASPVPLFLTKVNGVPVGGSAIEYDVSSDGKRFLMNTLVEQPGTPITLMLNVSADGK
jgi:hypothetical protein